MSGVLNVLLAPTATAAGGGVSVDATGTKIYDNSGLTSVNYTGITVGSGSHRALIVTIVFDVVAGATPSSLTATWDSGGSNQAMTLIVSVNNGASTPSSNLFGLVNPASGNKTLAITWTTAAFVFVDAISFTGVDQSGGTTSFPHSTSGTSVATLNVTSATGNYVVSAAGATGGITAITGTTLYSDTTSGGTQSSYANYDVGGATVVIGQGSTNAQMVATDIKAG